MVESVVILGGTRTAIGTFGGSLKDCTPCDLGALVIREALSRESVAPDDVGHVVMGHIIHTEPRDMYVSRVSARNSGIPDHVPALTVNRLCGSGVQAVISAAQSIMLGDCSTAVAGGTEVMSRGGYMLPTARWGTRMGDGTLVDMMTGALTDPFGNGHMGITAENIATTHHISREEQDALAAESHRRAAAAAAAGYFRDQITPVTVKTRGKEVLFDTDEHIRPETTLSSLANLKPIFRKDGSVTAGNASGINDGAAALVLMSERKAVARNLNPLARIVSYGHAGVDPAVMGIGPVPASQIALQKAGLTAQDMDLVESNEAFAAQACAVTRLLGLDPAKVNPDGGAIALGHPVGATGAILVLKAMSALGRTKGRFALVTMCIGGGQGIALILERFR